MNFAYTLFEYASQLEFMWVYIRWAVHWHFRAGSQAVAGPRQENRPVSSERPQH